MKKLIFSNPHKNLQAGLKQAIKKPRAAYEDQRYNTPLFVLHETFNAFQRHNVFGLSASLSFYALFALIPLVLLMFFVLSHWVFSSDYAIVKLAIITSNLVPRFSNAIMIEVFNASQHQAAWGAAGLFVMLWAASPLAAAMRSTFYNIASLIEAPSFIRRKIKDMLAIVGILLLFFLFTFAGLALEKVAAFLGENNQLLHSIMKSSALLAKATSLSLSLGLTTLLIAVFYAAFFPVRLHIKHILIGALFTAVLWLLMRPAFSIFLSINESLGGSVFGGMKNVFISITWLYFNFAAFLLGTELIATLRKKDVLFLKGLFNESSQYEAGYMRELMRHHGKTYRKGERVFQKGDSPTHLYYVVSGEIQLLQNNQTIRIIEAGEYFGEMALLSNTPTIADAVITSNQANLVLIDAGNIETLLLDEPKVAMKFLHQMASKLQKRNQ